MFAFVFALFVLIRVLHANVMQSIMSHFSASPPSTNGPLLTDTYEFGNVISFSHNFAAATFCHFQLSPHSFAKITLSLHVCVTLLGNHMQIVLGKGEIRIYNELGIH